MKYSSPTNISSQWDYDPGGMILPGREYIAGDENYRFGFNGQENTDEIYGDDNFVDFGARGYDPRLMRWLSIDAFEKLYPQISPYAFALNNPIKFIDQDGNTIFDSEGNEVILVFDTETGELSDIQGTNDESLKDVIRNTWNNSAEGKETITKLDAKDVQATVITHAKRTIWQSQYGDYGEVHALSWGREAYKKEEKKGFKYAYGIDLFAVEGSDGSSITLDNLDQFEIRNPYGELVDLSKLSSEEKGKLINDINTNIASQTHVGHQESLEELSEEDYKVYTIDIPAEENGNSILTNSNNLMYETNNAEAQSKNNGDQNKGETAGKKSLIKAYKERHSK